MTQNQSALALYLIGQVERSSGESFTHLVKVMSPTSTGATTNTWMADDGQGLKQASIPLMNQGIKLLAMDIKGKLPSMPEQTVRYQYGLEKHTERAGVIFSDCNQLVMRNLRNWILSAPITDQQCG